MRLASSWMVITSGMITSRITLSRGSCTPAWRSFSRSRLRRREASERSRWASSKALLMVSLIRSRLSSATLTGLLTGLAPFFLLRASSSTSGSISAARPVRRATCSGRRIASPTFAFSGPAGLASPSFFGGSSTLPTSALATTAGSCSVVDAGAGSGLGSSLGRSASRRARSRSATSARSRSASSARRRASSSSVESPLVLGCAGCATSATVPRSAATSTVSRTLPSSASPGVDSLRVFFFSTTTDFERPWLKLWRTWPDSTVRFRLNGLLPPPRSVLSVVSFVSDMHVLCSTGSMAGKARAFALACSVTPEAHRLLQHPLAGTALGRCSMYHIWPADG